MNDRDAEVRSQALREAVAWLRARADAMESEVDGDWDGDDADRCYGHVAVIRDAAKDLQQFSEGK